MFKQVNPALEAPKELMYSPRGNNLDLRVCRKEGQFDELDHFLSPEIINQYVNSRRMTPSCPICHHHEGGAGRGRKRVVPLPEKMVKFKGEEMIHLQHS